MSAEAVPPREGAVGHIKQGVRRTTGKVGAELVWYGGKRWCDLPAPVCNQIRDLLDAACDLANEALV